jgi:hypothetical protein
MCQTWPGTFTYSDDGVGDLVTKIHLSGPLHLGEYHGVDFFGCLVKNSLASVKFEWQC